jgi:dephospho-CoA kinase
MTNMSQTRFRCIAFQGGIATGKSTYAALVAEKLARDGFIPLLIDFDQLRRASFLEVRKKPKLYRALQSAGMSALSCPREISRFVLNDPFRIINVAEILAEEVVQGFNPHAIRDPKTVGLLEWPVPLAELLRSELVTDVVHLSCPVKEQLRRLVSGDLPMAEIRRRIRMQRKVLCLRGRDHHDTPELFIDTSNTRACDGTERVVEWFLVNRTSRRACQGQSALSSGDSLRGDIVQGTRGTAALRRFA